jgi:hypothetical protein
MGHSKSNSNISDIKFSINIHISKCNRSTDDSAAIRCGQLCIDRRLPVIRQAAAKGAVTCMYQHNRRARLYVNEALVY